MIIEKSFATKKSQNPKMSIDDNEKREGSVENQREQNKNPEGKDSTRYLELIGGHPDEKISYIIDSLKSNKLPIVDGQIRILEIGPGGGESLEKLKEEIDRGIGGNQVDKDKIAIDFIPGLDMNDYENSQKMIKDTKRRLGENAKMVIGLAQQLPFKSESFSAINASAVFHEIYSYSDGYESVNDTIKDISRALAMNGILAYRDLAAPVEDLEKISVDEYKESSWIHFLQKFLPYFLNKSRGAKDERYSRDKVVIKQAGELVHNIADTDPNIELELEAPLGLIREIQRHFITFRSDFMKQYGLSEDTSPEVVNKKVGDFFDKIVSGDDVSSLFYDKWLNKEGSESYIYYNLPDLIENFAKQSFEGLKGEYVMLPENASDIRTVIRDKYQEYLEASVANPLAEGKQLIRFKKMSVDNGLKAIEDLKSDPSIKEMLGQYIDMFDRLQIELKKKKASA